MSWDTALTPEERRQWDEWVRHTRESTVEAMAESAFVMQLVPRGEPDIKFAVELGLAIMLDKPIVAVVMKGRPVTAKLRTVADAVVELEGDLDTEAGQQEAYEKMRPFIEQYAGGDGE